MQGTEGQMQLLMSLLDADAELLKLAKLERYAIFHTLCNAIYTAVSTAAWCSIFRKLT
jgi:hypothetical protein